MRPGQTPWGHVGWLGSRADCGKASVWSFAALQFWAHSNCCQLETDSRSLRSSWTDTAADFWAKKRPIFGHGRTTRLLQACFDQKTILMTPHVWLQHMQCFEHRIFTCFLRWIHWFGEHLQPPGGMVVTTNMDLMETQFSRNLGTRMIAQVWKRKAWYFKAKRVLYLGSLFPLGSHIWERRHLCQDLRKSGSIHWQG